MNSHDLAMQLEQDLKDHQIPETDSTLFQDGLLVSKGRAYFEDRLCTFFPSLPNIAGIPLREPVTLRRLDTNAVLILKHFRWHSGCAHGQGEVLAV